MTVVNMLAASLLGAVALSPGALAKRDLTVTKTFCEKFPNAHSCVAPADSTRLTFSSESRCWAYASAGGESGGSTVAEAAADAAAYVCGGEGSATADAAASATATLFAKAVAEASVGCESSGDSTFHAAARSHAQQGAKGWLTAYAEAFATAGVCNTCEATVESFGFIEEYVFLEALASAGSKLEGYTTAESGDQFSGYVISYQETVQEAVATAYAAALADGAGYKEEAGCFAWVNSKGCIFSPAHPDPEYAGCFECEADAVSIGFIEQINAVVDASADAAVYTCGAQAVAQADAHAVAKALAEATAVAISQIFISCKADNDAYACAGGGSHIEQTAKAVAKAWAEAYASGLDCEDTCVVDVNTATESMGSVLAAAAAEAWGSVCVEDGAQWTVLGLAVHIETNHVEAIADAAAIAFSAKHPNVCVAAVSADTSVGPDESP